MFDSIEIALAPSPVRGRIRPPGSKSITNRALVCAALAEGKSTLIGALDSEDTQVMVAALRSLGIKIDADEPASVLQVVGCGGIISADRADLYIANSGTSVRFLTALAAIGCGRYRFHGTARMHERPIQDLLDGLGQLGVRAISESGIGCPPVIVEANGLRGGNATVRGDVSSQFLSGLLMAAPYAKQSVELAVAGKLVSRPYVKLTLAVMRSFGIDVADSDRGPFAIPLGHYRGCHYRIEPDASAASYFFAVAAITGGEVTVEGLSRGSLQGDVEFVDCLEQMGCEVRDDANSITVVGRPLRGIEMNMNAISDTVQTLAVVALFASGPTTIAGVAHNRHKETDRIGNLAIELRKLGAEVCEHEDGLTISPRPLRGAKLATYHDHRMAMSLALAGLRVPGVVIDNPRCTEKTYPNFFSDLARLVGK
ncbi:MAG: 3-phosphoshikimate 1-carboxyvinyltransferase [Pirellulales bacterium]|nr:3-phosphoshikimate 1-carboxyvinyltransferase [Pirellulales bacterium]